MVTWLNWPSVVKLFILLHVVLVDGQVSLPGKLPNSRCPDEDCQNVVSTDPALVPRAIPSVDTPLRRARHNMFMTELPLDYTFREVHSCAHIVVEIVCASRLDNVAQLEPFTKVSPFLLLGALALELDRRSSVHLHHSTLVQRPCLLGFFVVLFLVGPELLDQPVFLLRLGMDPLPDPRDGLLAEAFIVAEMQAAQRLRFAKQSCDVLQSRSDESTAFQVDVC